MDVNQQEKNYLSDQARGRLRMNYYPSRPFSRFINLRDIPHLKRHYLDTYEMAKSATTS